MSEDEDFFDTAPPGAPEFGPIFTATYESDCAACNDPIVPGEDARADGVGGWIHADDQCERVATAETRLAPRPHQSVCTRCFTVHAGECV